MEKISIALALFAFLAWRAEASELKVLCEGHDISRWVRCPKENDVLQVETAEFGRGETFMCPPNRPNSNNTRLCGMKDVRRKISPLCDGKQRCDSLAVNTTNLGELEQCRGVEKYLLMYIECVKIQAPPLKKDLTKEKAKTIVVNMDKTATSQIQFEVRHGLHGASSAASQPLVEMAIAFFIGTSYSLYY